MAMFVLVGMHVLASTRGVIVLCNAKISFSIFKSRRLKYGYTVLLDIGLRFRTANITQTVPNVSSIVP